MKIKILQVLYVVSCFIACKKEVKQNTSTSKTAITLKHAKGFEVKIENGVKNLLVHAPFQNANKTFEFVISKDTNPENKNSNSIQVPIERMVVTSTTHIPMVELLNEQASIVGFPYSKYVSSKKTRQLIDDGKIIEIGKESSLNTEILLDLQPQLVVGYSVNSADKSLTTIE